MKTRITFTVLVLAFIASMITIGSLLAILEEHLDHDRQAAAAGPRISEDGHVYHNRTNR